MATNKDGLEPGKPVAFKDYQRIKREHRNAAKSKRAEPAPKRGRPKKVDRSDEQSVQDSPVATRQEAQEGSGS